MNATPSRRAMLGALAIGPLVAAAPASAALHNQIYGELASPGQWRIALSEYRCARQISDDTPSGHPDEDVRVDTYCDAQDHLVEDVPAPDHEALLLKMEMARERWQDFPMPDEWLSAFAADVRRLGGR